MPTITVRLKEEEKQLLKESSAFYGLTLSDFVKRTLFEKIEDELDLRVAEKAYEEHLKDPVTYSFDKLLEQLDEKI